MRRIFKAVLAVNILAAALLLASPEDPARAQVVQAPAPTAMQAPQTPRTQAQVSQSFAPVVKRAAPAVVNIYTKRKVQVSLSPLLSDPVFRELFGGRVDIPRERVESSLGSGVIVDPSGQIVTNHHVVRDSDEIRVVLADRREFAAKIVYRDEKTDLAVLHVDTKGQQLPFLPLRDSDTLEVGDIVLAIGNPFGVGQTVTQGIISGLARTTVGITDYGFFIQTDAAINPGNSGGALVDSQGNLIGVNTAIFSKTGGSIGIGFAIPANIVQSVVEEAKGGGKVARPWLGVGVQEVTASLAESLGLDRPVGALVNRVYPNSPAAKAGLKVGDVITAINGHEVNDAQSLNVRVATTRADQQATLAFIRSGKSDQVSVTLTAPPDNADREERLLSGRQPLAGAVVGNLGPRLALDLDLDPGLSGVVVLRVNPNSAADDLGFQKGDLIAVLNGTPITSSAQLAALVKNPQPGWQIGFVRGGRELTVVVR